MKRGDLTTMLGFSISHPVNVAKLLNPTLDDADGLNVVQRAVWLESDGDSEILKSELWVRKSPDIWLVTSLKK